MSIFSRLKQAVKSKANAAVDKATDPEKELDLAIAELDDIYKKALEELVSYKAMAKKLDQDIAREDKRATEWEQKAMAAVRAGNDELAKQALLEQKKHRAEADKIKRDRDQAAGLAIQLNKSRKEAETKLRMLKLRKGTLATQLKAARSGGNSLGVSNEPWDRFEAAESRIDDAALQAEVEAALNGEELGATDDFDRKLLAAGADPADVASAGKDDPLAALKAKMAADAAAREAQKKLPK